MNVRWACQNRAPVVDLGHIPSLYIHRHHASNPIVFFRYPILFHFIFRTIRRNGIFRRRLPVVGVQRLVNGCGFGFSDAFDLLEILDIRLTHGTNRAEMAQ